MKIVMLIGDSFRHYYVAHQVAQSAGLAGLVVEQRDAFIPEPPSQIDPHLKELLVQHFAGRAHAETSFFGEFKSKSFKCPVLPITETELNTNKVWDFLAKVGPDLVISYGVHKLSNETLLKCPPVKWNVHGGLSPVYRGVITHFWPSYMLEPQMTGMTLHNLTDRLDAGDVVHQNVGKLVRGDGVHELACRTVHQFGVELPKVLQIYDNGRLIEPKPQKSSGKLWLQKDWRPEHLRLVYDLYNNRVVDAYLDGQFKKNDPSIVSQLQSAGVPVVS